MKIVVPSHKRPKAVSTTSVVNDAIICVAKSQEEEYRYWNKDTEIVTHDDDLIGISKKRQWIYKKFGDVFMLDDDILALRRTYTEPKAQVEKFTKDDVTAILFDTYYMLKEQTDIKLWGFSKSPSPLHYNVTKPIHMNGFIQGCALGMIADDNLNFPDIDDMIGEDEYIALLNGHFNRKMWIDKRFFFQFKTTNYNVGGCEDIRDNRSEKESFLFLKKNFGNAIKQDLKKIDVKWRMKIPY